MAVFATREVEGMRQVVIDIENETVRARNGALSNLKGNIDFVPRLPSAGYVLKTLISKEVRIRPSYNGTWRIFLQPSLSGYHVFEATEDERWILEPGVYWASEGGVGLGLYRERFWPSLWAGDGMLVWKTTMWGPGQVALNAPGPVEVIRIEDAQFRAQGRLVLGRTDGLRFSSERPARFPRNMFSGQSRMRVYSGTGRLLVCWTPYWNQYMYTRMTGEDIEGTIFE